MGQIGMDGRWRPIRAGEYPSDRWMYVLVWHTLQGVMVVRGADIHKNAHFTHWQTIDPQKWVYARDRLPEAEDADVYGCVVSQNIFGNVRMMGWRQFRTPGMLLTDWQKPPEKPALTDSAERGD